LFLKDRGSWSVIRPAGVFSDLGRYRTVFWLLLLAVSITMFLY
jgi:hypothetical protein